MSKIRARERTATPQELAEDRRRCLEAKDKTSLLRRPPAELKPAPLSVRDWVLLILDERARRHAAESLPEPPAELATAAVRS